MTERQALLKKIEEYEHIARKHREYAMMATAKAEEVERIALNLRDLLRNTARKNQKKVPPDLGDMSVNWPKKRDD